jgi:hypothetical protein
LLTFNVHRRLSCCGGNIYGKQTRQEMVICDFPRIPRVELEAHGSKTRCAAINGNYPHSFHLIALPGSSMLTNKGKGKVHSGTGHEGPRGEERYSSTLSFNLGARWGGLSTPSPGHFTPGKVPVPTAKEAGWGSGPVWTGAENLAPTEIRSPDRPSNSE